LALALMALADAGQARADGLSLKASGSAFCRENAANKYGCARIRGYVAAGSDFAAEERMGAPLFLRPLPALPGGGAALAPRPGGSGFDGRFLIDASHDASFR